MHLVGGCFVPQPRWEPGEALRLVEEQRITSLYLVPTLFHDLVNHPDLEHRDLSSVRALGYAGAAMTSTLVRRCAEVLPTRGVRQPLRLDRDLHVLVGRDQLAQAGLCRPALGEHAAPDPRRAARSAPTSPSDEAFTGYWNRPDADAKAIRDGWYHTGDTGHLDEDGDLWIDGRVDDMIISGGENVHPLEVEDVLAAPSRRRTRSR